MARKPPTAYASMELPADDAPSPAPDPVAALVNRIGRKARNRTEAEGTLKARAVHVMLYLSPEFVLAVKRFALESGDNVKAHDIYLSWLQEGADRRGLQVRARVPSRDRTEDD